MQEQLFRKKSVDRISSPEQLQDYMRVTTPAVWMVLAAVAALLVGLIVSSALATLESTLSLQGEVSDSDDGSSISITLPAAQRDFVAVGMPVRVAGEQAHVTFLFQGEEDVFAVAGLDDAEKRLPEGVYDVEIVTETLSPISFLLN